MTMLLGVLFFTGCSSSDDDFTDTVSPEIDQSIPGAFPLSCSQVQRGETFTFKVRFTDNLELGSYGIDIHNNFDHHNHDTETGNCPMDPVKTPENPFVLIKNQSIPGGLKTYDAEMEIEVPADVDPGDYHFMIKVTDKTGWQTVKGLSIKILP